MITARRLHEARARERAGALPSPPPRPASIPWSEHELAIQELTKKYELELGSARANTGDPTELEVLRIDLADADKQITNLREQLETAARDHERALSETKQQAETALERVKQLEAQLGEAAAQIATLVTATVDKADTVVTDEALAGEPVAQSTQPVTDVQPTPEPEAKPAKADDKSGRKASR